LDPDEASAARLWPESLINGTDAVLTAFERNVAKVDPASDDDVLDQVKAVVLAPNEVSRRSLEQGLMGYETGERDELCLYIEETLAEVGVDVDALTARQGITRHEITDEWREW
jgi:hypothetical protein